MFIIAFLLKHPQKITGALLVGLGAIQANITMLQQILTPRQFAFTTIAVGCVVAVLGFINTQKPNDSGEPQQ